MPTLKVQVLVFLPLLQLGCEHMAEAQPIRCPHSVFVFLKSDAHNSRKQEQWRIYFSKRARSDIQFPEAAGKQSKQKWSSESQAVGFGGN